MKKSETNVLDNFFPAQLPSSVPWFKRYHMHRQVTWTYSFRVPVLTVPSPIAAIVVRLAAWLAHRIWIVEIIGCWQILSNVLEFRRKYQREKEHFSWQFDSWYARRMTESSVFFQLTLLIFGSQWTSNKLLTHSHSTTRPNIFKFSESTLSIDV
jgi:hypothetical protein